MSDGTRVMWMRGSTSKGAYFLDSDLPSGLVEHDKLLLRVMGSPDPRQIDGMGGADPLTSKVAVVKPSKRKGVDIDYLFLQVFVDQPIVTDAQNCGNILAVVRTEVLSTIRKLMDGAVSEVEQLKIAFVGMGEVASAISHSWGPSRARQISAYDIKLDQPETCNEIEERCVNFGIICKPPP